MVCELQEKNSEKNRMKIKPNLTCNGLWVARKNSEKNKMKIKPNLTCDGLLVGCENIQKKWEWKSNLT